MLNKRAAKVSIGIDIDSRVVANWRALPNPPCDIVQADAASYLSAYEFAGDELVYVDPPYVPSTRRRARVYTHDYDLSDHEHLLSTLKTLPCMVILSGYESGLYDRELRGWHKSAFTAMTHAGVRTECVWMNYSPPNHLHDGSHLGDDFRARQAIQRRRSRFERRFADLEPRERYELLRVLNDRFGSSGDLA